ncbi:MAG TPA: Ku protein [Steroidobacteraceae bacterium]|jgi:DNA end-binding protein Ku
MAGRPIASVTISFGLVSIPVQVFTAAESAARLSFNLLHKDCGSRLKQQYTCVKDGQTVERADMVKGYEFAKDQYVQFTADEIKALDAVGSDAIDIVEFVPLQSIDPIYFEKTYYLAPDKGGLKPYALLVEALRDSKRCAVGSWSSKGKQHTVALRPAGGVLVMQQLLFASEIRSVDEIVVPDVTFKDAERKLALQLIAQQSSAAFDPSAYTNEVKARIDAAIEEKVKGKEITMTDMPRRASPNVVDLMDVLRKSLKDVEGSRGRAAGLAARKPPQRVTQATGRSRKAAKR